MPTASKALPFDEKNDRDFEEMTVRIRNGLDSIRKDKSLKPTQATLAKLAQCSRRTLSLRVWPAEELKRIKESRAKLNPESANRKAKESKANQNESQLISQIRNYQDENGKLYDRVQDFEDEKSRWAVTRSALEEEIKTLTQENHELRKKLPRRNMSSASAELNRKGRKTPLKVVK